MEGCRTKVRGRTLLLGFTALLHACAGAPTGPFHPVAGTEGEGVLGSWVYSGGYRREYILHTPDDLDDLDAKAGYPLLVMMHGAGGGAGTASGLRRWTGIHTAAADAGYITVFPEGLDGSWEVGCGGCTSAGSQGVDDIQFIETLVRHLAESLPVDTTRVFLAGHSLGAQFVHYFACEARLLPAGIAAVSGLWLRSTAVTCRPGGDFPVLMIHGDQDRILPWGGPLYNISALSMPEALERWSELLECTGAPEVVERPGPPGSGPGVQTTRRACRGGTSVVLQRIRGGGHGWPGAARAIPQLGPDAGSLDGVREILSFFRPYAFASDR